MKFDKQDRSAELVFGIRPVIEAIKAGKEVDKILLQKDLHGPLINELTLVAQQHKVPSTRVPIEKLNSYTRKNHQGVVAFISAVIYASLDNIISQTYQSGKIPSLLILDRVTDVRNFGAIARTAECLGVNALVIPSRGSAQVNSDAVKTSAGALNYIPICREDNLKNTITYLKENGFKIVACTEKTNKVIYDADFTGPSAIIMGSEENGISPEYLKRADEAVKIPMLGNIESLNVSVATGMILSEMLRQRRK